LRDFHKICRICTSFQDALSVKVSLDLLKGLWSFTLFYGWSYGGFKLMGSGYPEFLVPTSGAIMRQTLSFRGARTFFRCSITMPNLVVLGFHTPPGGEKR